MFTNYFYLASYFAWQYLYMQGVCVCVCVCVYNENVQQLFPKTNVQVICKLTCKILHVIRI